MNAEIISIGTELLLGHIINTNASFISRKLAEIGLDVYHQSVVGDNPDRLADSIIEAASRSDIVIMTGGLGPTVDDVTTETVALLIGKRLILNKSILKDLRAYFKLRGVSLPKESLRQAYIPDGVKWIRNTVGTAPALITDYRGSKIICLPGPPREMIPLLERDILPYLKRLAGKSWLIRSRVIKIAGLAESQVNGRVKDLLELRPPVTVGIYAKLGEVDLKIMAKDKSSDSAGKRIARIENIIRKRLGRYIFGSDDETLEGAVGRLLIMKKKTLAIAESCTGGLVANRITDIAGSSRYFMTGVVAYSNSTKIRLLGVSAETLRRYGAVSKKTALEMAKGVRLLASADIGIGITGIAGPAGGTRPKPVGLVYIAFSTGKINLVKECRFKGARDEIKFQASQVALDILRRNSDL